MAAKYKKRSDGRYLIQIVTGYKPDGKPKHKNIYAYTIRELEEKASKAREEIQNGIIINDERLTVQKWAVRWFELYKANVGYNTKRLYETALNVHIYPSLGMLRLRDVKPHHAQELINKLVSLDKKRMAELVKLTLSQIFSQAMKNGYLHQNIMDDVELQRRSKTKKRALTRVEIEAVRNASLPIRDKLFAIMLLTTGLRRGEAFALMKSDIDMEKRTIKVNKNALVKKNQMEIKNSPKSAAGNRNVPIVDELYGLLSVYLPTVKSLYLFPGKSTALMSDTAYRLMWGRITDAMNIAAGGKVIKKKVEKPLLNGKKRPGPSKLEIIREVILPDDITPHIFRHTYATLLYEAGVDIKTAQYLLGHATLQVTIDIYTELSKEKKEDEMKKFNTFMNNLDQSEISQTNNVHPKDTAN